MEDKAITLVKRILGGVFVFYTIKVLVYQILTSVGLSPSDSVGGFLDLLFYGLAFYVLVKVLKK